MSAIPDIVLPDSVPESPQLNDEEADQLARSNKKVKTIEGASELSTDPCATSNERDEAKRKTVSFKDMVINSESACNPGVGKSFSMEGSVNDVSDDEDDDGDENDSECPTIKLSKDEKRRLRNRWKDALIIKLIDHTVGYTYLVRRLKTLWRISGRMDVIDVGHGAYVVRFADLEERARALYGGPWVISDHYLVVTQWFHNFDPETYSISKLAVWVRFPNMPMEYYDPIWLIGIGKRIGNPLRVDVSTASAERGRYARLCVEIDLSKPLFSKFRLRRKVRRIEYEGIHVICFNCGRYGHRKESCRHGEGNGDVPTVEPGLDDGGAGFRRR